MKKKPLLRSLLLALLTAGIVYGIYYCWISFPIITGYGAKTLCSAIFVAGRDEQQVRNEDLGFFPISLGHYVIDRKDSSVTGSLLGLAKQKAIFRTGLGATLVSEWPEQKIRRERFGPAAGMADPKDSLSWPLGDRLTDTLPPGLDTALLSNAFDSVFAEKDPKHLIRTRAAVVVYKGQLVGERYAPGFSKDTRLLGWSMTKSITGALIGMLVKDGKLREDDPAPVPEWSNPADPRHGITLKNLLQQCSGLKFEENYAHSSNATIMLYECADMGAYTAAQPLANTPGSVWYYSSGNTNILSRIVRQTVGESEYHAFPYERLFGPLGMYSALLEPDPSGTFVGSSYMYASARDWARFGLFYLKDGVAGGERLLPEGWVAKSTIPVEAAPLRQYGYQIWLNAGPRNDPAKRVYPHAPTDMVYLDGHEGNFVYVIPSKQLVVVRLGLTEGKWDGDTFLKEVLQAIPQ